MTDPTPRADPLRARATLLLEGMSQLQYQRGRLSKVTVDDAMRLLAHLDGLVVTPIREALSDILDLSKGEPRMSGASTFPANAHRMGRIHNRARQAFGEEPLTIADPAATPAHPEPLALCEERERELRQALLEGSYFHVKHDGMPRHPETCSECRRLAEQNREVQVPS